MQQNWLRVSHCGSWGLLLSLSLYLGMFEIFHNKELRRTKKKNPSPHPPAQSWAGLGVVAKVGLPRTLAAPY